MTDSAGRSPLTTGSSPSGFATTTTSAIAPVQHTSSTQQRGTPRHAPSQRRDRSDHFGYSIAINDGIVAIGAWEDNDNGNDAGSAYVFTIDCPADAIRDGVLNGQDFIAFLGLWAAQSPLADWTVDDLVNTQDFLAYLNDWVAGCP